MIINRKLYPEKVSTKDSSRPMLAQPWLDCEGKRLLSCDGFALAVIPVELHENDTTGPIPICAIKEARKAGSSGSIVADNDSVSVETGTGTFSYTRPEDVTAYPDVDQIIKGAVPEFGVEATITLDAQKLYDLAKALVEPDRDKSLKIQLFVTRDTSPVYVKPLFTDDGSKCNYGLIMPVWKDR